jgi:hypothetical protein
VSSTERTRKKVASPSHPKQAASEAVKDQHLSEGRKETKERGEMA